MLRLFIDPGLRACGSALFRDSELVAAGLPKGGDHDVRRPEERSEAWIEMALSVLRWAGDEIDELTIELPQIYQTSHQKAQKKGTDQNDLIHLAAVVSAICATYATIPRRVLLPMEWKSQIPKEIMHARAAVVLSPEELSLIPLTPRSRKRDHNTMDAVSMGLWALGRLRGGTGG